jgi:hypothetical protein
MLSAFSLPGQEVLTKSVHNGVSIPSDHALAVRMFHVIYRDDDNGHVVQSVFLPFRLNLL